MSKDAIHVTARAVIIDGGHLLLCQTTDLKNNFYFMPGGHVEYMESAANAILRELVEETGSQAKIKRLLGVTECMFEPGYHFCHNHEYSFFFEAELTDLKFGVKLPKIEPNIDLIWLKLEELKNIDFRPESLVKLLPIWLEKKTDHAFYSQTLKK